MKNQSYNIFFSNLANPLRIDIITSLRESEKNVSQLVKELKIEQSKLSHALSALKCCNIVESRQDGKQRIYSLNKETMIPMLKLIDNHAKNFCNKCQCNGGCK